MLFVEASQGSRGEWSVEHCINISLHLKHLDLVLKCLIYTQCVMYLYMIILKIEHINLCTVSVVAVLFDNQNLLIKEKNKNYYLLKGVLWGRVIYLETNSWWDLYLLESVPAGVRCRVLSSARGSNTRYLGSLIWRPHRSKLDSAVDFVWCRNSVGYRFLSFTPKNLAWSYRQGEVSWRFSVLGGWSNKIVAFIHFMIWARQLSQLWTADFGF